MKVQCDVCNKAPATLMCCADEAALCAHCDFRIHAANKLANKHQRIPLHYPAAPDDLPSCDICQDKTAFFFCLEDRALLCRECDYSIHSSKSLAAKHKRFLVTGIRVALHDIASSDASDSTQTCSISQLSSQSNKTIPKTCPTKSVRANIARSSMPIPQKPPPLYSKEKLIVLDEEKSFSNLPLSSNTQLSKQMASTSVNKKPSITSNVKRSNTTILQTSSKISSSTVLQSSSKISNTTTLPSSSKISSSSINQDEYLTPFDVESSVGILSPSRRIQFSTQSQTSSQQVSSSNELYAKGASTNVTMNQQVPLSSRRQVDCLIRQPVVDASPHQLNIGPAITCQLGGTSYIRRGSISEYLTETIPGWKVDELLSLSDTGAMYNFNDTGSSRAGASSYGEMDWPNDNISNIFDDSMPCGATTAEVPTMPSPPTLSGIPRSMKPFGYGKSLKQHDLNFILGGDDSLVVPDIGGISSPFTSSPTSPPLKRRRTFMDF